MQEEETHSAFPLSTCPGPIWRAPSATAQESLWWQRLDSFGLGSLDVFWGDGDGDGEGVRVVGVGVGVFGFFPLSPRLQSCWGANVSCKINNCCQCMPLYMQVPMSPSIICPSPSPAIFYLRTSACTCSSAPPDSRSIWYVAGSLPSAQRSLCIWPRVLRFSPS